MALFGLTTNFNFKLIDFDISTWHDDEYDNWREVDALLFAFLQLSNVLGVWTNSIAYVIGDRLIDGASGRIWECQVAHTSAASPTLFVADRAANPTFWTEIGAGALNAAAQSAARKSEGAAALAQASVSQAANSANEAAVSAAGVDVFGLIMEARVFN